MQTILTWLEINLEALKIKYFLNKVEGIGSNK
jgi:hypothetical protein